jgi:chorismate mutase
MSVEEVMEKHGFHISASCAGKASYTKWINHKGKRAYVAVTDVSEEGVPGSLDQPIRVGIYDVRSGDEIEPVQDINSLRSYLESLGE